jgi:hypothetical protein
MKAMNSVARYGLVTLNTIQDALSLGFNNSQIDNASIITPEILAVTK